MLNEWTYCQRLGVLEWLHGEFDDNADTVEGTWQHRRVDKPGPDERQDLNYFQVEDTLRWRSG